MTEKSHLLERFVRFELGKNVAGSLAFPGIDYQRALPCMSLAVLQIVDSPTSVGLRVVIPFRSGTTTIPPTWDLDPYG